LTNAFRGLKPLNKNTATASDGKGLDDRTVKKMESFEKIKKDIAEQKQELIQILEASKGR
jgi:hypothetical protein